MEQPHQNGDSPKISYDVVEDYCNSSNEEDMLEFVTKNQEDHGLFERHEHLEWENTVRANADNVESVENGICKRDDENDEDYECNYTNRALRFSMVIEKEATEVYIHESNFYKVSATTPKRFFLSPKKD
ncbi:hypothetical protein IFM89_026762 [Coptis chinensis]|uniref:Uncharacterized protein n=1 Tax=Coptis chinensis TaxID=261450 RepID=A0A835HV12_9MAGN|nr:hypothetical protein IFM89_026762 [Coptis chinensis]